MAKAHPPGSFGSGEDGGQANASEMLDDPETNEYGDEGFDSEDPSPIRRTSGDELRRDARKGAEDSSKNAALRDYDNSSDPEMELEISASSSDAGDVELGSAQPTQPVNGKGSEAQEMDNSSLVPQLDDGKGEAAVNDGSNQEDRKDDSALAPRKTRPPEADERGSVTDFQEPRKPPDDLDEGYLSPRVPGGDDDDRNHDQSVGSLDMYNQSSFQVDDDRNSPQGLSPYRPDGAGRGSLSDDDGSGLFSPQPFASPEEGLDVDGGMHNKQLLALQYNGDRCSTRGKQPGGIVRGRTEFGHVTPRARSQENGSRRRGRDSSPRQAGTGIASHIRREKQERLIQQLTRDNGALQRKVAGYQLALQLSADEDDFSATTSFSAAMKLQRAAPPPFPRDGGTPAPSPRVTRGWTHKNPPSPTRTSPVERNLSYTTLVRQLDAGGRRARTLKRVNEELGARVNELESGGVLRAAQSRLAERDEEIVVLREELSVMNRLARAQDRKFEGSQGYALARRLWLAEEELRLARSTISALGGEVYGLRQFRKTHSQDRRRRRRSTAEGAPGSTPDVPSKASASRPNPRRPVRRRGPNFEGDAAHSPRTKRQDQGKNSSSSSAGRASRSPTAVCFGRSLEASGSSTVGGGAVRSVDGGANSDLEGRLTSHRAAEVKAERLQRALANMRSKAKGELRAAQAEIDELKEDKAVLGKTLDIKAKEIRMQLLQVNRLKRELRDLSAGATKLEEASGVAASASRPMRTRGISSAAAAAGQASATGATKIDVALIERRVKSAAVGSSSNKTPATVGAGRASLRSLVATQRAPPPLSDNHPRAGPRTGYKLLSSPVGGNSLPMEWNRDWGGDGTEISRAPVTTPPDTTPVKGEVRRGSPGSQTDPAMAIYGDGESGGIKAGEAEERQTAANDKPGETEGAPVSARKKLRPCPLAGILDMSEPPLRNHRRSYYNEDDGKVYLLPQHGDTSSVAGVEEPPREEERFKCVVDFKGDVRHGEDCVLREVARTTPPPSERNSLASKGGSGQQPSYQTTLPAAIPVRMWHKERTSEWAPAGVEATERLSLISNRDRSPRTSCVSLSEDGRFTPTIGFVRRPTHFSVEAVPESEKERV